MTFNNTVYRRTYFLLLATFLVFPITLFSQEVGGLPALDLHVHLSPNLSIEHAVELSKNKGVQFGIVEHPGLCEYCPIQNDSLLLAYITKLHKYPVYVGLQPVVPGWRELFSPEILSQLDCIIMDAMEIPQEDGPVLRIWMDNTRVENLDAFMEMYTDYTVRILETQDIDVLANATFLPKCIEDNYSEAWTSERILRIIQYAVENNVAFEINSYYKVPSADFIRQAKAAGAKFSFGTNSRDDFAGTMEYALQLVKACQLDSSDIFVPSPKEN